MNRNLVQRRSGANVWETADRDARPDLVKWIAAIAAGACLARAWRRRSPSALWLAGAGVTLAWWAVADREKRRLRRVRILAPLRSFRRREDMIEEASLESFPASDATAFGDAEGSGRTLRRRPFRRAAPVASAPTPPVARASRLRPNAPPTDPVPPPEPRT